MKKKLLPSRGAAQSTDGMGESTMRGTFADSGTIIAAFVCQPTGVHYFLTNHYKVDP
jgi:hypothetical protein